MTHVVYNDLVNRQFPALDDLSSSSTTDYRSAYEQERAKSCKLEEELKRGYEKREELSAKLLKSEDLNMALTERGGKLEHENHELRCENICLREKLRAAERCIISMALQLHGGGDEDA